MIRIILTEVCGNEDMEVTNYMIQLDTQ
jgi:hypothetical protein